MILRILAEAEEDIRVSAEWYEGQRQGLGFALINAATRAMQAIEENPRRFAKVEMSLVPGEIRGHSLVKFPFMVIYEIFDDEIVVLAVAHHRRRPDYWISRRN